MKEASSTVSISHWPGFTIIATERVEMEERVKVEEGHPDQDGVCGSGIVGRCGEILLL